MAGMKTFAQLICRRCGKDICPTKHVELFKWRETTHLASVNCHAVDCIDSVAQKETQKWIRCRLNCPKCQNSLGLTGMIDNRPKSLFRANGVAFHIPESIAPVTSLSGYPTCHLYYPNWRQFEQQLAIDKQLEGIFGGLTVSQDESEYLEAFEDLLL